MARTSLAPKTPRPRSAGSPHRRGKDLPRSSTRLPQPAQSLPPAAPATAAWHRPTVSSQRDVQDIASHLLDGSVRHLSVQRDGHTPPGEFRSHQGLVDYLHRVNGEWTAATRRLSPRLLIEWIESTGAALERFPDIIAEGDRELGLPLLDMVSVMT